MLYVYFLDIQPWEKERTNQKLFQLIQDFDIPEERIYVDDTGNDRTELDKLLDALEKEDMLIIRSVTDLTDDINGLLVELFPLLTEKGVELFSCEESFLCGYEYQNTLVGVIELLRYFRSLKKADNYQRALEAGKVGRPSKTDDVEKAIKLYQSKIYTVSQIERLTGVSKSTLYRYLKEE